MEFIQRDVSNSISQLFSLEREVVQENTFNTCCASELLFAQVASVLSLHIGKPHKSVLSFLTACHVQL